MTNLTHFFLQQTFFFNFNIEKLKYYGVPPPLFLGACKKNKMKIRKIIEVIVCIPTSKYNVAGFPTLKLTCLSEKKWTAFNDNVRSQTKDNRYREYSPPAHHKEGNKQNIQTVLKIYKSSY